MSLYRLFKAVLAAQAKREPVSDEPRYRCPACGRPVDELIVAAFDTYWTDRCDTCGWKATADRGSALLSFLAAFGVCLVMLALFGAAPNVTAPFTLELDDYEAANLLHALVTHPCLNSGDWYMQIRHKLDRWALDANPNPLYCQRNGGHGAPALSTNPVVLNPSHKSGETA